jgi:hypothetical protein
MLDRADDATSPQAARKLSKRPCCIIAELMLSDNEITLDGVVRWMVTDRALFREATRFILKRKGDSVRLRLLGEDYPATILGTSADGYELYFDNAIDADIVEDLVGRHLTDE